MGGLVKMRMHDLHDQLAAMAAVPKRCLLYLYLASCRQSLQVTDDSSDEVHSICHPLHGYMF